MGSGSDRGGAGGERLGLVFCLLAAVGYGTVGILAKAAYAAGVGPATLLAGRFVLATALLWPLILRGKRGGRGGLTTPSPGWVVAGLLLGAVGYGVQVSLLFLALRRIDASLASLLFYVYPALVTLGALLLGRETVSRRRLAALALALAGVGLVFSGGVAGEADGAGVLLALASAVVYAGLVLVVDRLGRSGPPPLLSALVPTGAMLSFAGGGALLGLLETGFGAAGWLAMVGLAVVGTVLPLLALFAGIARVGPAAASLLLALDPVLAVALAALLLGERPGPWQGLGGLLVLAGVVLSRLRRA